MDTGTPPAIKSKSQSPPDTPRLPGDSRFSIDCNPSNSTVRSVFAAAVSEGEEFHESKWRDHEHVNMTQSGHLSRGVTSSGTVSTAHRVSPPDGTVQREKKFLDGRRYKYCTVLTEKPPGLSSSHTSGDSRAGCRRMLTTLAEAHEDRRGWNIQVQNEMGDRRTLPPSQPGYSWCGSENINLFDENAVPFYSAERGPSEFKRKESSIYQTDSKLKFFQPTSMRIGGQYGWQGFSGLPDPR